MDTVGLEPADALVDAPRAHHTQRNFRVERHRERRETGRLYNFDGVPPFAKQLGGDIERPNNAAHLLVPRVGRDEAKAWSRSFKNLIHIVRMTSRPAHPSRRYRGLIDGPTRKPHLQRCAVRVTYSPNRVRGQWAAHGRYIARESAAGQGTGGEVGFSAAAEGIKTAKTLADWQTAGDPRLFKLIISPEFGERLDLRRHTRELLSRMETDLGLDLGRDLFQPDRRRRRSPAHRQQ